MAVIHHPEEWPTLNSNFIAAGSLIALKIKPTIFSTSEEVKDLDPEDRQCNYAVSWGILNCAEFHQTNIF